MFRPLCIIPARGGSKGLPGKHLLDLGGKPVIHWTALAASESEYLDAIVVSSDSEDILRRTMYDNIVSHHRTSQMATDESPVEVTLRSVLEYIELHAECIYDPVVWLQADCPIRLPGLIDWMLDMYKHTRNITFDSVVTVKSPIDPPEWLQERTDSGVLSPLFPSLDVPFRRQDTKEYFQLDGSIMVISREQLLKKNTPKLHGFLGRMIPQIQVFPYTISIDTEWDYKIAKLAKLEGY